MVCAVRHRLSLAQIFLRVVPDRIADDSLLLAFYNLIVVEDLADVSVVRQHSRHALVRPLYSADSFPVQFHGNLLGRLDLHVAAENPGVSPRSV